MKKVSTAVSFSTPRTFSTTTGFLIRHRAFQSRYSRTSVTTPITPASNGIAATIQTSGCLRAWLKSATPYTPPKRSPNPTSVTTGSNLESYFFQMRRTSLEL